MKDIIIQALVYFGFGMFGIVIHWLVKFFKGDIAINLFTYLFINNFKATCLTVLGLVVGEFLSYSSGIVSSDTPFQTLIGIGFMSGYTADSALNKAESNI